MSKSRAQQIQEAQRRLDAALRRRREADLVIDLETFRIDLLRSHQQAGPGHVFTPDPPFDLTRWTTLARPAFPVCRLCALPVGSESSKQPCVGDIHVCQVDVAEGETPTAFQQYGYESWLCGHRGIFADDFSAWTCAAGHRTDRRHQRGCLSQLAASCPCRYLIVNHCATTQREGVPA